jgi:hypothetical protein
VANRPLNEGPNPPSTTNTKEIGGADFINSPGSINRNKNDQMPNDQIKVRMIYVRIG